MHYSTRRGCFFFFNDTATTEIYTLSLHDALPILAGDARRLRRAHIAAAARRRARHGNCWAAQQLPWRARRRSEEHTSELQSRLHLACRLLLEKRTITLPRYHGHSA